MLKLVGRKQVVKRTDPLDAGEAERHHIELIERFLRSHRIRNHAEQTINRESKFLKKWFVEQGASTPPSAKSHPFRTFNRGGAFGRLGMLTLASTA